MEPPKTKPLLNLLRSKSFSLRPISMLLPPVRNSHSKNDKDLDPVACMNQIAADLAKKHPELAAIPIHANHALTSSCSGKKSESEYSANGLEVCFAPAKDGTDKRMWIRLPHTVSAFTKSKFSTPADALSKEDHIKDLLRQCLDKEKTQHMAVFAKGDSAMAELAFPADVDRILELGLVTIPAISPYALSVFPACHIELHSPYDIIITSLNMYSGNVMIDGDLEK
ncbi:hypothetical protein PQX77_002257 [Marasmius sp. AFHP31]|nr:hypothetical protein PQX77_002257 [Marasmius sp. AFHP31]